MVMIRFSPVEVSFAGAIVGSRDIAGSTGIVGSATVCSVGSSGISTTTGSESGGVFSLVVTQLVSVKMRVRAMEVTSIGCFLTPYHLLLNDSIVVSFCCLW